MGEEGPRTGNDEVRTTVLHTQSTAAERYRTGLYALIGLA